ncbi:DNA-processing protein DprA [Clostridium sp. DJ247]|uniref:DNA-processing protein DprA n=1 Tax=Clostridium sp. DJ247 TaxID=2726188 RepID=UPI001629B1A8|nr:DNA-processing protein DprA [Clostridium sp. DJ247]MBC2578933.1 DNA-protecting protein DprA [Clostridium sp. DJ247]
MNKYDLWFSMVKLPNKVKLKLVKEFKSIEDIWYYCNCNNRKIFNDEEESKIKHELKKAWDTVKLEAALKKSSEEGMKIVNFNDERYPKKLRAYEDSPSVLFYKGNIDKLNHAVSASIVGSRNCSIYGRNVASLISKELAANSVNIISGMARGIDAYAHSACIERKGYTCAILGSGIDVIYPKENKKLYYSILENGCIISEFFPGTRPNNYNFPVRNRIISALSNVVIVIEASEKSGSLITANLAAEQGKDVVAVPGSIFSDQSKGTNKLIRDGAYPFTGFQDLFEILNTPYKENSNKNIKKLIDIEKTLCTIISDTPIHIDDIFRKTNIDIKRLYEVLFELQLRNEIICLAGNYYAKVESKL